MLLSYKKIKPTYRHQSLIPVSRILSLELITHSIIIYLYLVVRRVNLELKTFALHLNWLRTFFTFGKRNKPNVDSNHPTNNKFSILNVQDETNPTVAFKELYKFDQN